MSELDLNISGIDRLQEAIQGYEGDAEKIINEVLHGEGGELIQEGIFRLMPISNREWNGKKPHARNAKSLRSDPSNLAVTTRTTKQYQYLYFPDDGSNTRNHVGNQQFFLRGAEAKQEEIIDLCIPKLIDGFEDAIG